MKWYCAKCWRSGEMAIGIDEALRQAERQHRNEVNIDMAAQKIPAGVDDRMRNTAIMDKMPAADCAGDIKLGDLPARKLRRFDPGTCPSFDFEVE